MGFVYFRCIDSQSVTQSSSVLIQHLLDFFGFLRLLASPFSLASSRVLWSHPSFSCLLCPSQTRQSPDRRLKRSPDRRPQSKRKLPPPRRGPPPKREPVSRNVSRITNVSSTKIAQTKKCMGEIMQKSYRYRLTETGTSIKLLR